MSLFRRKKAIILFGLLIIISGVILIFNQKSKHPVVPPVSETTPNVDKQGLTINIDFDGDGVNESVKVIEDANNRLNMEAYNAKGNKIATLWDGISLYPTSLYKVINLSTKNNKQYLQWNMAVGPHQVETVFLTLVGDLIHPIYSFDFEKKTMYSPFYTSRGEIVVGDANYDGLSEVIENVDEYPIDAPRLEDKEIEDMIRRQFSSEGVDFSEENTKELVAKDDKITGGMLEIVKRENNGIGRGRKVILAIHSFIDAETPFFRRLTGDDYEKVVGPLISASRDIAKKEQDAINSWESDIFIRYNDLEQDSKNFNDLVRDFWTHGRPFEAPIPEDQVN